MIFPVLDYSIFEKFNDRLLDIDNERMIKIFIFVLTMGEI
jgi:hypothetical protein